MNVTCTACPAKYAVPDEKVRGKKVRITCKHCGTHIVVDGTAAGALSSVSEVSSQPGSAHELMGHGSAADAPKPAAAPPPELTFLVGFADDRQESLPASEIVKLYRSGELDDDVLVWRAGMSDWLSPFQVPELEAVFRKHGVARNRTGIRLALHSDDEPTLIARSPLDDFADEAARPASSRPPPAAASEPAVPSPAPAPTAPPPGAALKAAFPSAGARRTEKRGSGVDLFGSVADAGSENDPLLDFPARDEPAHKLTGARNESSVLFSLESLTQPEAKSQKQKQKARDKQQEEESFALFGSDAPDPLLNIGGGDLAALAAADLAKPAPALVEPFPTSEPALPRGGTATKSKGGVLVWLALLGVAAAAGGAFVMLQRRPLAPAAPAQPSGALELKSAPSEASTAAADSPPAQGSPTPAETASAAALASVAVSASAIPANPAAFAGAALGSKPASPAAASKPPEPAAAAAKPEPAPPASEGLAFDKGAALAALGAAAASAGSCKTPDGPTGTGKVSVTFAPSGRATATSVAGALAGTDVGGCVARLFRAAKVPAFSGDPVTVSKSFSIE